MISNNASLLQSSDILTHLFANVDVAFVVLNLNREVMMMNRHAERLTGYSQEEMVGKSARIFYDLENDFTVQGQKRYNPDAEYNQEHYITPYITKQGRRFWGDTQGGPVKDENGKTLYFVAIVVDVTERYRSTQTLNKLHDITSDRNLNFKERMQRMLALGCEHFELPIGILSRIENKDYIVEHATHPDGAIKGGEVFDFEQTYCYRVYKANDVQLYHKIAESPFAAHPCYSTYGLESYIGSPVIVDGKRYGTLNFSSADERHPFSSQDREIIRLLAQWVGHEIARTRDIEELNLAREKLEHAANTDTLTGLPNRRYINQELDRQLSQYHRFNEPLAIAIVDFDNFKILNDTYGHDAGDQALIEFADITARELRKYDLCGRWGGEEFMIVFPNTRKQDAANVLERLRLQVMNSPITHDGNQVFLSISIGLTECRANDVAASITKRADAALYSAKDKGRNCLVTNA